MLDITTTRLRRSTQSCVALRWKKVKQLETLSCRDSRASKMSLTLMSRERTLEARLAMGTATRYLRTTTKIRSLKTAGTPRSSLSELGRTGISFETTSKQWDSKLTSSWRSWTTKTRWNRRICMGTMQTVKTVARSTREGRRRRMPLQRHASKTSSSTQMRALGWASGSSWFTSACFTDTLSTQFTSPSKSVRRGELSWS